MNGLGLLVFLPMVAGAFGTLSLLQLRQQSRLAQFLAAIIGSFLGLGLASTVLPLLIVLNRSWPSWFPYVETAFWAVFTLMACWFYWKNVRYEPIAMPAVKWLFVGPLAILTLVLLEFGWTTVQATFTQIPFGDWDATQIWNYHARFLSREHGQHFRNLFQFADHHPEYPLFLPATVARFWIYDGSESPEAPQIIAVLFFFGTTLLLITVATLARGWLAGLLAGVCYLSPNWNAITAASQYADGPLAFWFLASVGVWLLAEDHNQNRVAVLSGLLAGLGAWTKNEGLPFALLLGLTGLLFHWRTSRKWILFYWIGATGPVLMNLWWKSLCPPNDLIADQQGIFHKLTDFTRWSTLLQLGGELYWISFGGVTVFLGIMLASLWRSERPIHRSAGLAVVLVGLMAGVYTLTYLLTPHELEWHMKTSFRRLVVHLWPLMLFGVWSIARPIEELLDAKPKPSST